MSGFLVVILIFCTKNTVQLRRNFSDSATKPDVYQSDRVLDVKIGDSATLPCCIFGRDVGVVIWYKQPNRKQPRIMSKMYKPAEDTFFNEFQNPRFQGERSSNCFKMTISNIVRSDEATYFCAIRSPYSVFGEGTYLKLKETSKPALCDNSVVCQPTLHGNNANINAQDKAAEKEMIRSLHGTVLGLGTALGLCALLIICLACSLLRRRKCAKMNTSMKDSPATRQEPEAENVNYAALQFPKRKAKAKEKSTTGSVEESVYSSVKYNSEIEY